MSKEIVFSAFKFYLTPYEEENLSFEFDGPKPEIFKLLQRKNEIFQSILNKLSTHSADRNMFKLIDEEKGLYLFKISNKKSTVVVENFESKKIQTDPYVYLVIDNNPKKQFIYISEAVEVFKTINATKNVLLKVFRKHLHINHINIEIEEVFDKKDFWQLVKNNENKINYINIELVKPIPYNNSKNLYESFQNFSGLTNAYRSNILLRAPQNSILKGINQKNKDLRSLVKHSSDSGGDIKIKILGVRKQISTNNTIKKVKISELDLQNTEGTLFKLYSETFRN